MRTLIIGLLFLPLAGCTARTDRPAANDEFAPERLIARPYAEHEEEMGPPPPGYIKIRGNVVPHWRPSDMHQPGPDSGWTFLGPQPISGEYWSGGTDVAGRVVGIAVHPTNGNIAYIASASGGVWKTTNGGTNWTPLTDELSTLNHGAIALAPSDPNTIYVGTGEWTTRSLGDGLFRSTNAGAAWSRIATTSQVGNYISRLALNPVSPGVIHVSSSIGYVRSTDSGVNWSTRLAGNASDVIINPITPTILFVGLKNDGIYRSTDGGDTLTKLTAGLPTSSYGQIVLGLCRSAPSTVYAAYNNSGNSSLLGMWKTTNGGDTWTQLVNTPDIGCGQGWYNLFVVVDPNNPNNVYAGGVTSQYGAGCYGAIKSTDGGASWTDVTVGQQYGQIHPDMHVATIGPDGAIWLGCDGGVWKSVDAGANWLNCNHTLALSQNYAVALHPTDASQMMTGTQDNGTPYRFSDQLEWPEIVEGDGGYLAFDWSNPDRVYTTYVYLDIFRITSTAFDDISGPWGNDPRNFISPIATDPSNSHVLLGGTNRVWRSTNADGNADWTAVSPSSISGGGVINAITVAPSSSSTIYCGSSAGNVGVTTNVTTWNDRSAGLPGGEVSWIKVDPNSPGTAYVAFYNSSGPRVLKTTNFGVNWTDMTGTLPTGVSATALAVEWRTAPPTMYVGTGVGVYESANNGATWTKDGTDLPNVNIGELAIDTRTNVIVAGTYGRGAWRKSIEICTPATIAQSPAPVAGCLNQSATFTVTPGGSTPFTYQWRKDGTNISGATAVSYTISSLAPGDAGNYDCKVSNGCGNATSNAAALSVTSGPLISQGPADQIVDQGAVATFTVMPKGGQQNFTYQWQRNGTVLSDDAHRSGSHTYSLVIDPVQLSDSGTYNCVVAPLAGGCSTTTNPATLTVNALCPGDVNGDNIVNLSDLAALLAHFGLTGATLADGDVNGDGVVNLSDLALLLSYFGATCP